MVCNQTKTTQKLCHMAVLILKSVRPLGCWSLGLFGKACSLYIIVSPPPNQFFSKRQGLDSSKLKEFADDNFKYDENDRKFSKSIENSGNRKNCSSPYPTVFSKDLFGNTYN